MAVLALNRNRLAVLLPELHRVLDIDHKTSVRVSVTLGDALELLDFGHVPVFPHRLQLLLLKTINPHVSTSFSFELLFVSAHTDRLKFTAVLSNLSDKLPA